MFPSDCVPRNVAGLRTSTSIGCTGCCTIGGSTSTSTKVGMQATGIVHVRGVVSNKLCSTSVHHHYAAPFGITAEYAHPIETLFLGLGTLLGPMFFARHLLTVWVCDVTYGVSCLRFHANPHEPFHQVWLVFRLYETIEDHSGYILPWYFNPTSLIPFWGGGFKTSAILPCVQHRGSPWMLFLRSRCGPP